MEKFALLWGLQNWMWVIIWIRQIVGNNVMIFASFRKCILKIERF